jgi:L-ribulose-5-phosphate 4-epimerase
MLKQLKKMVCNANQKHSKFGLKTLQWRHVSGIDRDRGLVVVKPADITCSDLEYEDMIVVDMEGNIMEGEGKLPADLSAHLGLYEKFQSIGGVASSRSQWATIYAQSGLSIPVYGTAHLEFFKGEIPCTRAISDDEIHRGFEHAVANVIAEAFADKNYSAIPGVLVKNHAPFAWGESPLLAVQNAAMLETTAKLAYRIMEISWIRGGEPSTVTQALIDSRGQKND